MNVKKLLAKAKWTGTELGRLYVASSVANTVAGTPLAKLMPPELPLQPAKLQEMIYTVAGNAKELAKLQKYNVLYDFLDRSFMKANAFHMQMETRLQELTRIMSDLVLWRKVYKVVENTTLANTIATLIYEKSFDALVVPAADYKVNIKLLSQYRRELENGLVFDVGYNSLIASIAYVLDLPEVSVLKLNLTPYKARVNEFNTLSNELSEIVDVETVNRRRIEELVKNAFTPLPDEITPPARWVYGLSEDIKSFKAFSGAGNRFVMLYREVWHE